MSDATDLPRWYKFRTLGVLRPGLMKVEFIPPPQRPGFVTIHDVFADEVPIALLPVALRIPNSEFWMHQNADQTIKAVQGDKPSEVEDY